MSTSTKPGMGAIPYGQNNQSGVTFRTWAPFASKVEVVGTFNDWEEGRDELEREDGGMWSKDLNHANIGDEYKFLITNSDQSDKFKKTDPFSRLVRDNTNYNAVVVKDTFNWEDDHFITPPWNELVIYELHIASFLRNLSEPGNFASLTSKLDYLKQLGINAVLLLPIFGFKGKHSMGYNTALPFDIESAYGGPDEFKNFIKEAHKRGIAVLLDVVLNHFGPQDLDKSLWQYDGWKAFDEQGGIYFYTDWRRHTAFGDRPDYGRTEVRKFLRDNIIMWEHVYRVDGFRFDSTVNIRNAFGRGNDPGGDLPDGWSLMQWINNSVNDRSSWKIKIAEDLQNNAWITAPTYVGGAGFDSQWNSFFFHMLDRNITASQDADRNMYEIRDALNYIHHSDLTRNVVYVNNHDECAELNHKFRLPDRIWRGNADSWFSRKRSTLAAGIVFTSPGIPMIFQGDEFYEWGSWKDSVEIDWSKTQQFEGIVELHRGLIMLRRNMKGNTKGLQGNWINVFHINNEDKVIAYHRWYNGGRGDDVVIVANFSVRQFDSYAIGFPRPGQWTVRFNSDWQGYSDDFSNSSSHNVEARPGSMDGLNFHGDVGIGPYTIIILSQ